MDQVQAPRDCLRIPERKLAMPGYTYFHYAEQFPAGVQVLKEWVGQGRLNFFEDHAHALEHFPSHVIKMFTGEHRGKLCMEP